ncbi:MAG: aminomethyl transferase family protein [Methanobacteriota archaeon]|nr:MAG: aminomethyl transferase family protein [Euryarchaeota archaeon]
MEYYAIRHSAGMLDVSPLYKYLIRGKDALSLVNKVVTRNARKLAKGQIYYTPWCDERGKTVDDGTLWNFGDGSFRMTSAEPNLKWLQDAGMGLDAEVRDVSEDIGALAVQGPSSRAILMEGADGAVQKLKYFRFVNTAFAGIPVQISRTGYTGDLGYEIWVERERAEALWDALMDKGRGHDITPAGMLALDVARIEAGLILAEVEYMPARKAVIDVQRYSPYELSLDWTVASEKGPFIGRKALLEENRRGPARRTVGLVIDWRTVEQLYLNIGLPPQPPSAPWRAKIPLYSGYRQVGWATSGCWSPLLKKYIAIATVGAAYSRPGTRVQPLYRPCEFRSALWPRPMRLSLEAVTTASSRPPIWRKRAFMWWSWNADRWSAGPVSPKRSIPGSRCPRLPTSAAFSAPRSRRTWS